MFRLLALAIAMLILLTGCDEGQKMMQPVLTPEITEPEHIRNLVDIDGEKVPVFDSFLQAISHSSTSQFLNEDKDAFFEDYCRGLADFRADNVYRHIEHVMVFSDIYARDEMISHFESMEDIQRVTYLSHFTRSGGIGPEKHRIMRWKIMTKEFLDVIPADYRDEKYLSFFEARLDDGTILFFGDENLFVLMIAYHPLIDRDLDECRSLRQRQRAADKKRETFESFYENSDFDYELYKRIMGYSIIFESGMGAWEDKVIQTFFNEYYQYFKGSGNAWALPYHVQFVSEQARDDFLQILLDADLEGGISENHIDNWGSTAFTYSTRSGGRDLPTKLILGIDNTYVGQ